MSTGKITSFLITSIYTLKDCEIQLKHTSFSGFRQHALPRPVQLLATAGLGIRKARRNQFIPLNGRLNGLARGSLLPTNPSARARDFSCWVVHHGDGMRAG